MNASNQFKTKCTITLRPRTVSSRKGHSLISMTNTVTFQWTPWNHVWRNWKPKNENLEEIKFLSSLIRRKLKNSPTEFESKTIENNLHKAFWKTCRDIFNRATNSLPTFSVLRCTEYFRNILTGQSLHSDFKIPGWIPKLPQPEHPYNDTPPTYHEVARAVRRAKSICIRIRIRPTLNHHPQALPHSQNGPPPNYPGMLGA